MAQQIVERLQGSGSVAGESFSDGVVLLLQLDVGLAGLLEELNGREMGV